MRIVQEINFLTDNNSLLRHSTLLQYSNVEVCMGMGKTGIPWVPWDSHGNGSKISHGMGMGWERELSAWEWELRRGNWQKKCCVL